jgi:AraC family transcriptional regulator, regulatory protein of adaptative response / methylated-DNA-[protein]-cysteine methyltransferase
MQQPLRFAMGTSSLGQVLVAASREGVCAILMGDDHQSLLRELHERFPDAELREDRAGLAPFTAQAAALIDSPTRAFNLPLDIRGTEFQKRVWQALRAIPPGATVSYGDIAEQLGAPKAVRAVARACASNAIAVAIPCHRVIRSDGALSGYRWGIERKRALLARES